MTEIGFYHLTRTPLEQAAPKILEKALAADFRVVVLGDSDERIDQLNERLWTYDPDSFLPHGSAKDGLPEEQPIYLTTLEENPAGAKALMVTDGRQPEFVATFERVMDMFDGSDEAAISSARKRWKAYKDAGHTLTYWQQNDRGGWEKKSA